MRTASPITPARPAWAPASPTVSWTRGVLAAAAVAALAVLLRVLSGVGFVNYDTLYALTWGQQLARGQTPSYGVAVAPTPHPLAEALGLALAPLGPHAMRTITVVLAFVALAGCGVVIYAIGTRAFGRAAGVIAAALLLTRVPILSYGVRSYIDVPYLLLVLGAVLIELRRPRAGAPVLLLLALAGLLRPEAWAFSGLYWLYLAWRGDRSPRELAGLAALVATAPVIWVVSDWLVTGHPFWSFTSTRHDAGALGRKSGIGDVPQYVPRRIGEILGAPVLAGGAVGGLACLWLLRDRSRLLAVVGVVAVVVFAVLSAAGMPINTRYAFVPAALLCLFCAGGLVGWSRVGRTHRAWWAAGAALVGLAILVHIPSQYRQVHRQMDNLAAQQQIGGDLVALARSGAIGSSCEPIAVPSHNPIPVLAQSLRISPATIVSEESAPAPRTGTYVTFANIAQGRQYFLDARDPNRLSPGAPRGFTPVARNRSWIVYRHC